MSHEEVSILILTEDSGKDAWDTVRTLIRKALGLIAKEAGTSPDWMFRNGHTKKGLPGGKTAEWLPATDKALEAMTGNKWTDQRANQSWKRLELAKAIATHLARTDGERFAFIHMDGDGAWSAARGGATSPFPDAFQRSVVPIIRAHLEHINKAHVLERLLVIVPYCSIEAWLYQNTREAIQILEEQEKADHRDVQRFRAWASNRAALDEEPGIKDSVLLHDKYNLRLATRGWPAREVYEARASFHHAVETMKKCSPLLQMLHRIETQREKAP